MENALKTGSEEVQAAGVSPSRQKNTPKTHIRLKSSEDFRFIIRMIRGMLKNGSAIAEIKPMESIHVCSITRRDSSGFKTGSQALKFRRISFVPPI